MKYNTQKDYGSIAKWLHWGTAIIMLALYPSVYFRHWFTEKGTSINWTALQLHMSFGMTLGALVLLRLIWRFKEVQPDHELGSKIEHMMASIGHKALYVIMIIAFVSGYLGTGSNTEFFFIFDIPKFEDTSVFSIVVAQELGMTFDEFEAPVDFLHKKILGKWLVWLLIVGHIFAALYHHFVKKDRTLVKMTFGNN